MAFTCSHCLSVLGTVLKSDFCSWEYNAQFLVCKFLGSFSSVRVMPCPKFSDFFSPVQELGRGSISTRIGSFLVSVDVICGLLASFIIFKMVRFFSLLPKHMWVRFHSCHFELYPYSGLLTEERKPFYRFVLYAFLLLKLMIVFKGY